MGWNGSLIPLFWILIVVFITQLLIHRRNWIKIPSVIAYIVVGLLIGNATNFRTSPDMNWIDGIGQFGLFYLMFLSGLELDVKLLQLNLSSVRKDGSKAKQSLLCSTMIFVCSLVLSFGLAWLMYRIDDRIQPWMMMLILSTTSLGIVLPVLKEARLLQHQFGQLLLTTAFIADFTVMIIISVVGDAYNQGFSWRHFIIALLLPIFYVSYYGVKMIRGSRLWNSYLRSNSSSKEQAVLALLGLYGIFTDFVGAEPMLGSFLAGILLACFRLDETNYLRKQLESLGYSFVIPIFFVMIGIHIPLQKILTLQGLTSWIFFILISAYVVKLLPMLWFGQVFGSRSAVAGGLLLSSNLTLVIVASAIAVKHQIIPHYISDALLVVAVISCILSPFLFNIINNQKYNP